MTPYETAKQAAFAAGTMPDGYFGDRRRVLFALVDSRIVALADFGYFGLGVGYPALDVPEAAWLLEHHPSLRYCKVERYPLPDGLAGEWLREGT
jgi:hypothetical protein